MWVWLIVTNFAFMSHKLLILDYLGKTVISDFRQFYDLYSKNSYLSFKNANKKILEPRLSVLESIIHLYIVWEVLDMFNYYTKLISKNISNLKFWIFFVSSIPRLPKSIYKF